MKGADSNNTTPKASRTVDHTGIGSGTGGRTTTMKPAEAVFPQTSLTFTSNGYLPIASAELLVIKPSLEIVKSTVLLIHQLLISDVSDTRNLY